MLLWRLSRFCLLITQWHSLQCSCTTHGLLFFFLEITDRMSYWTRQHIIKRYFLPIFGKEVALYKSVNVMRPWALLFSVCVNQSHTNPRLLITVVTLVSFDTVTQSKNRNISFDQVKHMIYKVSHQVLGLRGLLPRYLEEFIVTHIYSLFIEMNSYITLQRRNI